MMVRGVGFRLKFHSAERDEVAGVCQSASRARRYLQTYRDHAAHQWQPVPCRVEIEQEIPPHIGLGSGTQLGLAIAKGLAGMAGQTHVPAVQLASCVGRGLRSGLGTHGFDVGGFLVDGGKQRASTVAPLISRIEFPGTWRIVLVWPRDMEGLSGSAEREAFDQMAPMPVKTSEALCRLLLLQILPSIAEADSENCSAGLGEYGRIVGEYFSPWQGGVLSSPLMREIAAKIHAMGYHGVGQSSWGPTMFVLCRDDAHAEDFCSEFKQSSNTSDCDVQVVAPLNCGATARVVE